MKITSIREFRDKATEMFRSQDPILILRRGEVARGIEAGAFRDSD